MQSRSQIPRRGLVSDLLAEGTPARVIAEQRSGATQYRLLETVRQYARDRVLEARRESSSSKPGDRRNRAGGLR